MHVYVVNDYAECLKIYGHRVDEIEVLFDDLLMKYLFCEVDVILPIEKNQLQIEIWTGSKKHFPKKNQWKARDKPYNDCGYWFEYKNTVFSRKRYGGNIMNNVNLIGNLTFTPELKTAVTGNLYTFFVVAVNRNYRNKQNVYEADFIPVIAWKNNANRIVKYFKKGTKIGIQGKIKSYSVLGENESWKNFYCVIVENFYFCEKANAAMKPDDETTNNYADSYVENDCVVPELYDTMNTDFKGE